MIMNKSKEIIKMREKQMIYSSKKRNIYTNIYVRNFIFVLFDSIKIPQM
jgi:hypothetical protein